MNNFPSDFEPKKDLSDEQPKMALNHKKMLCDRTAEQLFYNHSDCYTMCNAEELPAMSKKKFVEIVGNIFYKSIEN